MAVRMQYLQSVLHLLEADFGRNGGLEDTVHFHEIVNTSVLQLDCQYTSPT
jgi:hypothetical protein